ncbi:hypothetical protein PG997_002066 [Apiospora hydei]|uniref:Uncharacterized protein n=1 Tax=Apiospora hydei TaxID=1337664 RepID=A0ABR1X8D2_9PEZI
MPQRQQQHPGPSFQARLERTERRKSYIYRHQATISFFFTLAALVQSLGSLIYLAVCRCYPVPHAPFLAGNIVYVVLWCVYVPFWLWSFRHAAYARREPSPQRWWRLYNPSDEPVEQQPRRARERGPVGGHVDPPRARGGSCDSGEASGARGPGARDSGFGTGRAQGQT